MKTVVLKYPRARFVVLETFFGEMLVTIQFYYQTSGIAVEIRYEMINWFLSFESHGVFIQKTVPKLFFPVALTLS